MLKLGQLSLAHCRMSVSAKVGINYLVISGGNKFRCVVGILCPALGS
jgi:hypothetical protein